MDYLSNDELSRISNLAYTLRRMGNMFQVFGIVGAIGACFSGVIIEGIIVLAVMYPIGIGFHKWAGSVLNKKLAKKGLTINDILAEKGIQIADKNAKSKENMTESNKTIVSENVQKQEVKTQKETTKKSPSSKEWKCEKCGHTNIGKFCSECGAEKTVFKTCKNCGAELKHNIKFCGECGSKVSGK